jgi:predicted GIY-YIG superfamily endonuclease
MVFYIYSLIDPRDNRLRYIGITNDPIKRYSGHKMRLTKTKKSNWIRGLQKENLNPIMNIIEELDCRELGKKREKYWIRYFKKKGLNLLNMTNGGECTEWSEERKKTHSEFMQETWSDEKYKKSVGSKISKKMKGRKPSKKTTDAARKKHSIPIIDNFGVKYKSMKEASSILNIEYGTIKQGIRHGYTIAKKYKFRRLDNGCS